MKYLLNNKINHEKKTLDNFIELNYSVVAVLQRFILMKKKKNSSMKLVGLRWWSKDKKITKWDLYLLEKERSDLQSDLGKLKLNLQGYKYC